MRDYIVQKRLKELCKNGHLSNGQNNLLLEEYRADLNNGVLPEDSDARTILILGNQKLVLHILKSKFKSEYIFDTDAVSVGKIGLIKAIDTFKPEKKIELSSFASGCIMYEVFNYFRDLRAKHQMPEDQQFVEDYIVGSEENQDRFKHLTILDTLQDDDDYVKNILDKNLIETAEKNIKYLSNREALCVILSHGLFGFPRLKRTEIGRRLHLSHPSIVRYNTMGLRKLKVLMSPDNELTVEERQLKQRTLKNGVLNNIILERDNCQK